MRWIVVPVITLAMLVVVPLGLRLLEAPGLPTIRRVWLQRGAAGHDGARARLGTGPGVRRPEIESDLDGRNARRP
jgi:hypothetical protein